MSPRATAWGAYRAIADALRSRITGGEFAPGDPLPSESTLRAEYAVARNTLRRALDQLGDEGYLTIHPGRGRTVAAQEGSPKRLPAPYRRVASALLERIESGELAPDDALPSESALAAQHRVSRGTVRRALAELEGAGLVEAMPGKGRFVRRS